MRSMPDRSINLASGAQAALGESGLTLITLLSTLLSTLQSDGWGLTARTMARWPTQCSEDNRFLAEQAMQCD